jgi:hypothetical protein
MERNTRNGVIAIVVILFVFVMIITTFSNAFGTSNMDKKAAKFEISALVVNRHNILINDTVKVSINVTNVGNIHGNYTMNIDLDGEIYQTKEIEIAPEANKTVIFEVSSSESGNHTLSVSNLSSYFNSYPRWLVGDNTTYEVSEAHYNETGVIQSTEKYIFTGTVIGLDGANVTVSNVFDNGSLYGTHTFDSREEDDTLKAHYQLVGTELVSTHYGDKVLSHFRALGTGGVTYDIYMDGSSNVVFKTETSSALYGTTQVLIDTSMPWVADLAIP